MQELLDAIEHDSLPKIKKLLEQKNYNLNEEVAIGQEYDLDEYDEIALLFYLVQKNASPEAIELLIKSGMDITYTNREGLSVIDIAIKYKRKDIIHLAKERGIDLTSTQRKSGLTPLMLAASFNDTEMMEFLISLGANPKEKDRYGMSALDYAKKMGQKKSVSFLENFKSEI